MDVLYVIIVLFKWDIDCWFIFNFEFIVCVYVIFCYLNYILLMMQ